MKLILDKIILTNFKGQRNLMVDFDSYVTNIYGANETGKTTIFDSFLWLFFDKDSSDSTVFSVKTLDENNQPYHRLDHEVTAVINADDQVIHIRKTLREKWTKPRGSADQVFDGHEVTYFWNEVPVKQKEFQAKIASLINEQTFKMISSPLYFNNNMKWQDRRALLTQMAGDVKNDEVIKGITTRDNKAQIDQLIKALSAGKQVEEYKKEIAAKKKTIKDELQLIPSRIDEAKRSLPDEVDYDAIEAQIQKVQSLVADNDALLQNQSKAEKQRQEKMTDLLTHKQGINRLLLNIEFDVKEKVRAAKNDRVRLINDVKQDLSSVTHEMTKLATDRINAGKRRESLVAEQNTVRSQWKEKDAENIVFNDNDFCCPTCKRAFEEADIDNKKNELTKNFNTNKAKALATLKQRGVAMKEEIELIDISIANYSSRVEELKNTIEQLNAKLAILEEENARLSADDEKQISKELANHAQFQQYKKDLAADEKKISELEAAPAEDKSSLLNRRNDLNAQLQDLQKQYNTKQQKEKTEARIAELEKQESEMGQELASFEGIEFCIEQFTRAKMDTVEARINGLFKIVRFKMFEQQINGGIADTCVAMVNGVPFSDVNTAGKIQAGLDIINAISNYFDQYAPIFIDNRESVTNIPDIDSQVINLIVSPKDKKLRIEQTSKQLATA